MTSNLLSIILPALAAALLVASIHVPLGIEVLKKGIIFIDLAIAQMAGLGMVIASMLWEDHPQLIWLQQVTAFSFAIASAYGFLLAEKKLPRLQEAIIGSSFILSSALALLVLANHPHGAEEVQHLLSGQILWVTWHQIGVMAGIYSLLLVLWFSPYRGAKPFYLIFAIAITTSVQIVGVYLVFASLIFPALAACAYSGLRQLSVGYVISLVAMLTGIGCSVWLDLPTGPVMVCMLGMLAPVPWIIRQVRR